MSRREDLLSGAEYLASIYGTEKDKVNCSFYFKIGACRHGSKCSRTHNVPTFSQTVLLKNLYRNPIVDPRMADAFNRVGEKNREEQEYFDDFFDEIFTELNNKYGEIEEMNVCDNIGEHMIGNVYIKFMDETSADKAVADLNANRWFNGEPIYAELSPVTDFREACCRQYELGGCNKGAFCNFMHLKAISPDLRRRLYGNRAPPARRDGGRRDYGGGGGGGYGGRGGDRGGDRGYGGGGGGYGGGGG
ncbi:hypothetical protein PFISCL1PPCAC_21690, partial [Pristionchus fissidentatus]